MKQRAFVRYTKSGKIVPGSMIITKGSYPNKPALWAEISTDLCCDDPGTATSTTKVKGFVRYTKKGKIVPGSLVVGKSYPTGGGLWREVSIDLCCNPPSEIYVLRLTFTSIEDANAVVGDASNVADWNLFFDLPNLGTPFQSVAIDGNTIVLTGGANIKVKPGLMYGNLYNTFLEKIEDTGCITSVGGDAFSYCYGLTDVVLPNCTIVYGYQDSPITSDYGGFGECVNLVNVSIPELITAGDWAFGNCYGLEVIDFPELTTTGEYTFQSCLIVNLYLPKLSTAANYSFTSCGNLFSVNLPLATQIGYACFNGSSNLINISLPSCVNLGTTVGDDFVFQSTTSNTISLTIPAALLTCNAGNPDGDIQYLQANNTVNIFPAEALNIRWDSILNADALVGDSTNVADWNSYFDLPTYGTSFSSVVVNGDIVSLYGGANIETKFQLFSDNDHILEVWDNAGSIVTLGDETFGGTFENCTLEKASFPAVTKTKFEDPSNYGVFGGCYYLTYASLPKLTTMEGCEFYACDALETSGIILPFDKITSLGDYVFQDCTQITSLSFPNVISVGDYAFRGCYQLASINLPKLKYAGERAFDFCNALTTINFPELLTAGNFCFSGCTSLTTINLPSLTTASSYCFFNCLSVTSISLPSLLTAANGCFSGNPLLTTVNLPAVLTVGSFCFSNSTALTTISLPSCTALGLTVGDDSVFNLISGNVITLTVPSALMTCDAGSPDGDIQALQSINTVTIITV